MKSIIRLLFSGLLIAGSLQTTHAQRSVYLGLKVGISIPNLQSGSGCPEISQGYSSRLGPYFGAFGFLIIAKNETKGISSIYTDKQETQPLPIGEISFDRSTDLKEQLHHSNFGLQGGIELSLNVGNGYLFFHAGGNYGLVNIQKDKQFGENNTGAATTVIGYARKIY